MSPLSLIADGARSLALHKLRSVLTMLGMVFGVGAVVAMLAISEGARAEALRAIEAMGIANVILDSRRPVVSAVAQQRQNNRNVLKYGLTFDDRRHLEAALPGLRWTVATRQVPQKVWSGARRVDAVVVATEPAYAGAARLVVARGRGLCYLDQARAAAVAVVGNHAARDLFRTDDPLGRLVRVGQEWFTVVGVLAPTRGDATGAGSTADGLDRTIWMPERTARARFGFMSFQFEVGSQQMIRLEISQLVLGFAPEADIITAAEQVQRILAQRHPRDDVGTTVPLELMAQKRHTQRIFAVVMGSIAGISLLVGGIGIMNIMLATVLERTREIGIRRAVGARRIDILAQFLVETVVLATLGGGLGMLIGILGALGVGLFAGWPVVVTPWALALAGGISGLVGVVFGLYPAATAANLQPVEALRST
jgi:putative ABC transport system permease protein